MIRSMTGYGRAQMELDGKDIIVEIKSVNHRYFDFSARVPRMYGFLEERLKSYLKRHILRGKVDAYVYVSRTDDEAAEVTLNQALAQGYVTALRELCVSYGLKDDLSVSTMARFTDIFSVKKLEEDEDSIWQATEKAAAAALEGFIAMREEEGRQLAGDLLGRCEYILGIVDKIERGSGKTVDAYRERLDARIREILEGHQFDEGRLLTEVAIFADKVSVTEEIVRLKSHVAQFEDMLKKSGEAGRKLDFIAQEMGREINTIGSKCTDYEVAKDVVELKAELEKIREQIQNIE